MPEPLRVALSGMGSVTSQSLVRAIRRSDPSAWILGLDADPWAVGLYQCDAQALVPMARQEAAYVAAVAELLREQRIDLFIPGVDPELLPVARHRARLEAGGCRVLVSSPEVIEICRDKERTHLALAAAGLPFVRTWSLAAFRQAPAAEAWPVVLKPRGGSGSRGIHFALGMHQLFQPPAGEDYIVQDYLIPKSWGIRSRGDLTLEDLYKQGRVRQDDEVGVQGVVGPDGSIAGLSACWHEHLNGIPRRTYCFSDPGVSAVATSVLSFLAARGLRGSCNLQGRITDQGWMLYEINPRFGANTGMRSSVGFNEYRAIVDLFLKGLPPERAKAHLNPDESLVCLRYIAEELVPRERIERLAAGG